MTSLITTEGAEAVTDALQREMEGGKRFVAVFPGVSQHLRLRSVDEFQTELDRRGIGSTNLEDVVETHVQPEYIRQLLSRVGVNQDTFDLLEDTPALRIPRLFSGMLKTANIMDAGLTTGIRNVVNLGRTFTPEIIESEIGWLAHPRNSDQTAQRSRGHTYAEITGTLSEHNVSDHALFVSASFTTQACIELYNKFDIALPDSTEFPPDLEFDPYKKD